jgi:hypothetical protein
MPTSQKLQIWLKPNCTWMFIGWSSTILRFFVPIWNSKFEYPTGTKNSNFVEDHPRNIPAKFGSNRPSGFGEEAWNVKSLQTTDDGRQVMARSSELKMILMTWVYWYYWPFPLLKYRKRPSMSAMLHIKFENNKSIIYCSYNLFLFYLVWFWQISIISPFHKQKKKYIWTDMGEKSIQPNCI